MESLGRHLRKHREARGISLEEIERVSKISISYLRALEEDAYHLLPARIFTIGFLKEYARCVGLDPYEVALRYRRAQEEKGERQDEPVVERPGGGPRRSIWIVGGGILLLILLWVFLYPGSEGTEQRVRTIRIPRSSLKEVKKERLKRALHLLDEDWGTGPPVGGATATGTIVAESREGLGAIPSRVGPVEVILQAVEETWVKVRLDDEPAYEQTLKPGEQYTCQARERVRLRIGNGEGLRIFYEGKVYEHLGKKDEVVVIGFPPPEPNGEE